MVIAPGTRASLRFAALELATLGPAVLLWTFVMHAAEFGTTLALWCLRVACTTGLWWATIRPALAWQRRGRELSDRDAVDIDVAMSAAPRRFMRQYGGAVVLSLAVSTGAALLATPRQVELGYTELLCSVMVAAAIFTILLVMEFWLFAPFDESRSQLGSLLHERKLTAQRQRHKLERAQLLLGAATPLAIYIGCCGIGWLLAVTSMRASAVAQQRSEVLLAIQQLRAGQPLSSAQLQIIDDTDDLALTGLDGDELLRSRVEIDLRHTLVVAAARVDEQRWVLVRREVDELLGWFLLLTLVLGASLSGPLIGTTLAHSHSLRDQLLSLGKLTRRVVEQGDISELDRLVSLRSDEVDALVQDFNAMLDMFEELTEAATRVARGELHVELERPGDLHDAFRIMVGRLHEIVEQIRATTIDVVTMTTRIHAFTQQQNQTAEQQSRRMDAVSNIVDALASSAASITETVAEVERDADQTRATTRATIEKIAELSSHATGVRELLDRIREIADRSDLLALNGSLEAVRAGESGRGFALVAGEMRRLAERVTSTVDEVRERVAQIDASAMITIEVAEASAKHAEQTTQAAQKISQVTREQSLEAKRAAAALNEAAVMVIAIGEAIGDTQIASRGLKQQTDALERMTAQFELRPAAPGDSKLTR